MKYAKAVVAAQAAAQTAAISASASSSSAPAATTSSPTPPRPVAKRRRWSFPPPTTTTQSLEAIDLAIDLLASQESASPAQPIVVEDSLFPGFDDAGPEPDDESDVAETVPADIPVVGGGGMLATLCGESHETPAKQAPQVMFHLIIKCLQMFGLLQHPII